VTSLREGVAAGAAPNDVQELLRAAQLLLGQGGHLDALSLLHGAIEQALTGSAAGSLPTRYESPSEARQQHARLLSLWAERTSAERPAGTLRDLLRRRPFWLPRALTLGAVLALTLRYAWASRHADWHQQNPEGDWLSRFYASPDFEGYPLVRYDVGVNYDFGPNGAADSMPKDWFSASWDTCLIVASDVTLTLQLDSDDSSMLWLDGVAQLEVEPGPGEKSGQVVLRQGLRHLRVDLIERMGTAVVRLQGLEFEGAEAYRFQRPVLEGNEVRCK
jgi:PA14 domain